MRQQSLRLDRRANQEELANFLFQSQF
jgi:hypothetical protein